jgi:hypothetical protein
MVNLELTYDAISVFLFDKEDYLCFSKISNGIFHDSKNSYKIIKKIAHTQRARAFFYANKRNKLKNLRRIKFFTPLPRTKTCFTGEGTAEHTLRREPALRGNICHLEFRMLSHQPLRFLDAIFVHKLIKRATELIPQEPAQIRPIHRQDLHEVHELEVRIEIGFLRAEPLLQQADVFRLTGCVGKRGEG